MSLCCNINVFTSLVFRCPRFTLHQFKIQTQDKILNRQQNSSFNVQPKSDVLMYPSTSPHLVRPHSSTPRASTTRAISNSSAGHGTSQSETAHSNTSSKTSQTSTQRESLVSRSSRETFHASVSREILHASFLHETLHMGVPGAKRGKPHPRSKSAHGRILTTPYHTNAGKKQLEVKTSFSYPLAPSSRSRLIEFFSNNDVILTFELIAMHCGLSRIIYELF